MSERLSRPKGMRLAKLSPLIALALLVALVFSVPLGWQLAGALLMLDPIYADSAMFEREVGAWTDVERTTELLKELELSAQSDPRVEGMFDIAAMETWRMVNRAEDTLFRDGVVVPMPFAADDEVFEPVVAWEREHDAHVWAWTVLSTGRPPLVASARTRGVTLEPMSQPLPSDETSAAAVDDGGDSVLEWLWDEVQYSVGATPALDPSVFYETPGGGSGTDKEMRTSGSIVVDGLAYRYILVMTIDPGTDFIEAPAEFLDKDPRDPGYDAWLERFASEHTMDAWVFGPLESEAVALRVPEGADAAQAEALAELVWPSMLIDDRSAYWYSSVTAPVRLGAEAAALAGAPFGTMVMADFTHSPMMVGGTGGTAPQTIAYLVALDDIPEQESGPLSRAWAGVQRFALMRFRSLFIIVLACLGVTLVISPTAFAVDRRRRARARAAEERERMRRDAHDKVFNRLSALSKRVAQVGDTALNGTGGSLTSIAEDIRSTVAELQGILGDDVHHTSSALTSVPLADQLASVCSAQAARLGIEVVCDVPVTVHSVDPALGWDLQCIAEEAITNAVRHGGATRVIVKADDTRFGTLVMSVADNGAGSGVLAADGAPEGSTGLRGMQKRVARHGGTLTVDSSGSGTIITAIVRNIDSSASGEA